MLDAGVDTVQLRIKQPPDADARWWGALRGELAAGIAAAAAARKPLYVNDHWALARELGASHVHRAGKTCTRSAKTAGRRSAPAAFRSVSVPTASGSCAAPGRWPRATSPAGPCGPP
ncbi:hypothetical protein HK414_07400 [Ramlibacter terrae]|uniref:Thiamine phosphate synthase/TenI domain-containing protein n=1 Tax=Ramlibacter terrae TaxID=2732511 RepID=A0ABX6P1A7_9BURK|nr:hypothetical protein HK414_07400 [Ramlibacter terrae]